jgi:lysozyme
MEGVILHTYKDRAGKDTIGCGHLCSHQEMMAGRFPGSVQAVKDDHGRWAITREQADRITLSDTDRFAMDIDIRVKVPLVDHEFDALLLWDFNTGGLAGSMLLKRLNDGEKDEVPKQMLRWTHIKGPDGKLVEDSGLVARRKAEVAIWTNGWGNAASELAVQQAAETAQAFLFGRLDLIDDNELDPLPGTNHDPEPAA